ENLLFFKCIDLEAQLDAAHCFLDTYNALPTEQRLACIAAILRRVSLVAVVEGDEAIASRIFPLAQPASLHLSPLPGTQSIVEQFDQLPEPCRSSCLAEMLKAIPLSIVVGAFESNYVERGEFDTQPGRRTGCYIFPAVPSEDSIKAILNACLAAKSLSKSKGTETI
ncbi:MAG: hypothetical protein AAGE59_37210, partial [Cyanobacteria bacterium P01_F01_bin.86]